MQQRLIRTAIFVLPVLVGAVVLLPYARWTSTVNAPAEPGTCWRMDGEEGGKPQFVRLTTGVRNLETCAASLEASAMLRRTTMLTGAYQGQFVFITPEVVQSSQHLNGVRYRVFDADTRKKVDADLYRMIADDAHPSAFGKNAPIPR